MVSYLKHPRIAEYRRHKKKWSVCTLCSLHKKRFKVCLFRGTLPCDLMFVGEAPGPSEDIVGKPFVGPAGSLLDAMLLEACQKTDKTFTYAITNIVCCFPGRDSTDSFNRPTEKQAEACRPRLLELMAMAKPKAIVTLGRISTDFLHKTDASIIHHFDHPAKILRAATHKQELDYTRFVHHLIKIINNL